MNEYKDLSGSGIKKTGKFPVLIMIAAMVLGLVGYTGYTLYARIQMWKSMGPPNAGPAGVIVTNVTPRLFADRIEAIGTAEANESITLTATETDVIQSIDFEEGQFTKKGTLLARLRSDEEKATYEEARKTYNRYNELAKTSAGSKARRDTAKAVMEVALARLEDRKITAPFDGILGLRTISIGDLVTPGTVITTLDDIDPIKVEFSVPEEYIAELQKGLSVQARTRAFEGELFTGTVAAVDTRLNPQTRAVKVKALIDNTDLKLRPGLLMNVAIVKNERTSLAVPEEAVLSQGSQKSVIKIVKKEDTLTAQPAPVTIGVRRAGYVEILSGLKEGDQIITEGTLRARPGAPVKIVETRTIEQQVDSAVNFANPRKKEAMKKLQEQGQIPASAAAEEKESPQPEK